MQAEGTSAWYQRDTEEVMNTCETTIVQERERWQVVVAELMDRLQVTEEMEGEGRALFRSHRSDEVRVDPDVTAQRDEEAQNTILEQLEENERARLREEQATWMAGLAHEVRVVMLGPDHCIAPGTSPLGG